MAKSVNRVFLLGNVGKDPEIRSTGGGTMVANFWTRHQRPLKDAQGNWQDRTEWHNIVVYERLAEIVRDYVKKGSKLFIEGSIQTRNWDDKEHAGGSTIAPRSSSTTCRCCQGATMAAAYSARRGERGVNEDQRPPAGQDDFAQSAEISDDDIPF